MSIPTKVREYTATSKMKEEGGGVKPTTLIALGNSKDPVKMRHPVGVPACRSKQEHLLADGLISFSSDFRT